MEINKYSKSELIEISKLLKKYRNLRKNIGKKSSSIIEAELSWEVRVLVEYFPTLDKNSIIKKVNDIFLSIFWEKIDTNKIIWKENELLAWWIRLFLGDDMLDISFENTRNDLRKI